MSVFCATSDRSGVGSDEEALAQLAEHLTFNQGVGGSSPLCFSMSELREQERVKTQENKMGTMPMGRLIVNISLPMMLSMLVQALYNIVDSIFVGRISVDNNFGLTAVGLAFPLQSLMIAVGGGTAVGINAMLSKSLGERDSERVSKAAGNGLVGEGIGYLLFVLIGLFAAEPFMRLQTDVPEVLQYGTQYLKICTIFSFGLFTAMTFERLLQSTGKTVYSMIGQAAGAVTNIILDPVFIFGLGPFPRMDVAGAAIATVVGQCVGGIVAMALHFKFNHEVRIHRRDLRPQADVLGQIYRVGFPSIIMQAVGTVMTFGMNLILKPFDEGQTVFGLYFKVQSIIFMPIFGLNNGLVSITAYNYGARNRDRIYKGLRIGMCISFTILTIGFAVLQLFPRQLLSMFAQDEALARLTAVGIPALRTISWGFFMASIAIIIIGVFQALGNGVYSMIVSLIRQLVVLLPAAFALSLTGNIDAIWWAFPIAETVGLVACLILFVKIKRKIIDKI